MVLEFYEAAQFTYTRPKDHLPSSSPCNSFAFFSLCLPCSVQVVRERELLFCSIISNWLFSFIALRLRLLNELNGYNNLKSGDILGRNLFQSWVKTKILQGKNNNAHSSLYMYLSLDNNWRKHSSLTASIKFILCIKKELNKGTKWRAIRQKIWTNCPQLSY